MNKEIYEKTYLYFKELTSELKIKESLRLFAVIIDHITYIDRTFNLELYGTVEEVKQEMENVKWLFDSNFCAVHPNLKLTFKTKLTSTQYKVVKAMPLGRHLTFAECNKMSNASRQTTSTALKIAQPNYNSSTKDLDGDGLDLIHSVCKFEGKYVRI